MWIRTQNKEGLIKCQKISIIGPGKDVYLLVELTNDNYIELGVYKSKERAIEVLDEIREKIINFEFGKANECLISNEVVYQMPKEGIKC